MFRFTTGDKMIINHMAYLDADDMEVIHSKLTTVYDNNVITTIPSCDCGVTKGRYMLGTQCPECGESCKDPRDKINPILWFEAFSKDTPFINPAFWNSLTKLLSRKIDLLRWLSDPRYNPKVTIPNYILLAKSEILGGKRDYRRLVNNLKPLFEYFIDSTELKSKRSHSDIVALYKIYLDHTEDITSNYLPILNKKLFVIENTTKGKYTSLVLGDILDAITTWLKASSKGTPRNQRSLTTGSVVAKLADLYIKYYDRYLLGKPGSFRKHIYGARSHFTFRTVISASSGKHRHNEIIPPWIVSLTTYRPHMLNKLIKRGYAYKAADELLNKSISIYNPIIEELQRELITESPYPQGLPVIASRNPELLQGSSQFMYIPRFNTDPRILTTSFSPLSAKAPHADSSRLPVI